MRSAVTLLCCCLAVGRAAAQPPAAPATAVSESGQFVAQAVSPLTAPSAAPSVRQLPGGFVLNPNFKSPSEGDAPLDPALLVISCEKIKQSVLSILGEKDNWQGRINLVIKPELPAGQGPFLTGQPGPGGWSYQLAVPSPVNSRVLLRAVVRALLVEMANREAGAQTVEVPAWLVAGVSARLQADSLTSLVLQPQVSVFTDEVRLPGLEQVRRQLRGRSPLTFQQLSWPAPEELTAEKADFFCGCSQLFLEELLRFPDGSHCLREMVRQLPRHLNWQTSFLQAFSPHFGQLLDVEKWWDLACVSFIQVDVADRYNPDDSWVPVEVRTKAEQLPAPAEMTLQDVIAKWDPSLSAPVLERTVQSLELLRLKASPELAALLDGYLGTLQSWLKDTQPASPTLTAKNPAAQLANLRRFACKELDALDARRAALRGGNRGPAAPARANAPTHSPNSFDVFSANNHHPQP
jgi:hypothetical protein